MSGQTCTKCDDTCATCTAADATNCETCKVGYYLKSDKSCSNTCDGNQYTDKQSGECKACSTIDTNCGACEYNDAAGKGKCTNCNGGKKVKTALDGTTTCVEVATGCKDENHFKADDNSACYLCSENTSRSGNDKGILNCKTCTKSGAAPECSACLDGYFLDNSKTCTQQCGANCATCSEATNPNKCSTCMAGFFLVTEGANKKCVPCGDTAQGGIDGCAECDNQSGTLKCTKCKPNRKPVGTEGTQVTCEEKTCEDPTACGGTAGSCGAIVVGSDGSMTYYCSQCRQQ
ncbi:Variant-specific surface protein [Giardia duodenalis]|uniref:Variant-specific surface protein n=1 Tax=Giardia intestinalis TaxID=5741 RepID=V6TT23_GIAIN|nr:Variant-specific surface protein [Giardia intestinalis]